MERPTRTTNRLPARARRRGGFTLAESLIASVILAVAVVGVSTTLTASFSQQSNSEDEATAISLARSLLEEITAKPFATASSGSGWRDGVTDRRLYQNVADFHGYTDSNPFMMLDGQPLDLKRPFERSVSYTCPASIDASGTTMTSYSFGLVTVTVTSPNRTVTLTRLLTSYMGE